MEMGKPTQGSNNDKDVPNLNMGGPPVMSMGGPMILSMGETEPSIQIPDPVDADRKLEFSFKI